MNLRKSEVLAKEISGNVIKYEAYREAWSRIKSAKEHQFFLEAITIQESIISDRIVSFLSSPSATNPLSRDMNRQYTSFYQLIQKWRSEFPDALQSGEYQDLIDAVDKWRLVRNQTIHAIVKSPPGEVTQSIDFFLDKAKEASEEGERLAREVCKWCKRVKKSTSLP